MPMPPAQQPRAALYARYSTDRQRETSIADQLREAHARAGREGWVIVAQHADEGISGSVPVALRSGGKALLADALAGRFDVLVLEGLDRLSREIGEAETITKRLEHRGIRIVGTADGYDSDARGRKVMRIARGLVNELYLDDLREKTHRGLAGQFARGYHVGGVTYGYRTEPAPDGRGRVLVIDEPRAAVVREIMSRYAGGESVRPIVHDLNRRGIPGPSGKAWAVSAIHGSHTRRLGLLHAEVYVGRLTWNRRQWVKDPETGARRYVERPRHEWQVRESPELRIVDADTWARVQARIAAGAGLRGRRGRGQSPRTLFGCLLRCGLCGSHMTAVDARRYGCIAHHDRGPAVCAGVAVPRQALERRLLAELRDDLLSPEALADVHVAVREALAIARRDDRREAARGRLVALQGEIERLADAVAAMGLSEALRARLAAAEAERTALERQLQAAVQAPALSVDAVVARWRRAMLDLQAALVDVEDRERVRALLAELIGPVTIAREGDAVYAEMEAPAERLLVAASGQAPMGVVAGACNTTRRRLRIR